MEAKGTHNWWMIGFFIVLFVAEFERELLVIASNDAEPLVSKSIYSFGDLAVAEGQWVRADGGDTLTPNAVHFQCRRSEGACYAASYRTHEDRVYRPELDRFDAEFGTDSITMASRGDCVTTVTRIDLATQEAVQTRIKSDGWRESFANTPELLKSCQALEDRIVSRLSGWDDPALKRDPLEGHFVPLLKAVAALL